MSKPPEQKESSQSTVSDKTFPPLVHEYYRLCVPFENTPKSQIPAPYNMPIYSFALGPDSCYPRVWGPVLWFKQMY